MIDWPYFSRSLLQLRYRLRAAFMLSLAAMLAAMSMHVAAAPIKISGTLVAGGNVNGGYRFSPDGSLIVFKADKDTDESAGIYSLASGGGAIIKLAGSSVAGRSVSADFVISPDGTTVLFLGDLATEGVDELYRVPIGGGVVSMMTGSIGVNGEVREFGANATSTRAVFTANRVTAGVTELYSAPIGPVVGGPIANLSGPLVLGGDVSSFQISPDGATVVFIADKTTDGLVGATATRPTWPQIRAHLATRCGLQGLAP